MNRPYSFIARVASLLVLLGLVLPAQFPAFAAANLSITPITWNIVGLDSNNVNVGPNNFPVGARVCNTGDAAAANVTATFVWDSADPYINLRTGSRSTLSLTSLAVGACTDFYFEVSVTRNSSAYNHTRRYHIEATADGLGTVSTPTPREIFVEHLVSQSRNAVSDVQYGSTLASLASVATGGTMTLLVGNTYYIKLVGATATNGYEQIESFINFPNTVFQVLSVDTTYTAESSATLTPPYDKLYGDACVWENDPNNPNYRACNGVGKAGGGVTITYQVRILSAGATNPEPLSTLIYDFSGSSYHYNADFGVSTRYAYILDPSVVTISKNFSPDPTNVGGVSTLTFTVTNPTSTTISGLNFTDTFPTSPGAMVVAGAPNASTAGCGAATFSPTANAASISFSNGSIAPNSTCTIKVNVMVPVAGMYTNTTSNLFINTLDTGNSATDTLNVDTAPASPAPVCGLTMAQWTYAGFATNPPPFPVANTQAADVTTASLSVGGTSPGSVTAEADSTSGSPAAPSMLTYGWANAGPINTATYPFVQFAMDTSKYTQVNMQFNAQRKANGPNNNAVYYSTNGTTWTLENTFSSTTSWAGYGPFDFTGQTNTTGITYFRIYGYGANTPSKGADLNLDNVTFTGCGVPNPATISKAFSPNPVAAGATSTLTFTLNNLNTGVALSGISFTDTLPGGLSVSSGSSTQCNGTLTTTAPQSISLSGGSLSAGTSCTITVTVTTSTSGVYGNISGFVSSTESGTNTGSSGVATASLTVLKPPVISKLFAPNPILAGGTSTLTFTISNPNLDHALTGVQFSDPYPSGLTNTSSPSGSTTCTSGSVSAAANGTSVGLSGATVDAGSSCTVTVNVTSISAGNYVNTSGAVSSTNGGTGNQASDTLTVNFPNPAIALLKQISTSASGPWTSYITVAPGTNVYYQFTVENTGDVPLSPISVTDPTVSTATCTWPANLSVATAGNDEHIAACTVGPISATTGSHVNTATSSGTYAGMPYISTPSSARYATPAITLAKSVAETSFTLAGDVLHYSYLVTNTGFAPLPGPVTVTDDKSAVSCPAVSTVGDNDDYFDPGENLTCSATYTITLADLTAGSVTNTASASAGGVNSNDDSETIYRSIADLIIAKSNNVSGTIATGNTFDWTITVNNAGVAGATFVGGDVILTDTLPGFASYYPQGPLTVTNGAIIPVGTINCSISGTSLSCVASGLLVTLPVGGSFSVAFAVTPTATGTLENTATVDPNNDVLELNETNNSSTDTVTVVGPPAISKNFSPDPININGTSTLTFTITNSNPGTELTGVAFSDPLPAGLQVASTPNASILSCGTPTFAPIAGDTALIFSGAAIAAGGSCTVSVDVTAATSGMKNNTSGNVTSINGGTGNTASDTLMVHDAAFTISKTPDVASVDAAGDIISYTVTMTNTGNAALTDVMASDPLLANLDCDGTPGAPLTTAGLSIAVSGVLTCSGTYTVTQADLDDNGGGDGDIDNTVTGDTNETSAQIASAAVNITQNPALTLTKSANPTVVTSVGDVVNYTFSVQNTGNLTLTNITLSDDLLTGLSCTPIASLSPGADQSFTCTGNTYTVTQTDLDNNGGGDGDIDNTATTTGTPPTGPNVTDTDSQAVTLPVQAPSMTFVKEIASAAGGPWNDLSITVNVGDTVFYRIRVSNTGNITLTGLTVDDGMAGCTLARGTDSTGNNDSEFEVGEEWFYTCSVTAMAGTNNNTATADTNETSQVGDNASYIANVIAAPGMNVIKDGALDMTVVAPNGRADAGDVINYTISVQNTGNTTLTGVSVNDPLLADLDCDGIPGAPFTNTGLTVNVAATLTCTGSYTLTQNDLDTNGGGDGDIDNSASATSNETGPDSDPNEETLPLAPAIDVTKTLDSATFNSPNLVRLTYTITVQNTGNVILSNLQVIDDLASAFPGAASFSVFSVTSASFTVNQGFDGTTDTDLLSGADSLAAGAGGSITLVVDVDTGGDEDTYINMAVGSGSAPDGTPVQDNAAAGAPGFVDPALTKAANVPQASVGDTVTFTITVTNQGNMAAPNVVVTDTLPAVFDVTAVNVSVAGPALVPVVNVVPAIGVGPAPYTVTVNIGTLQVTNVVTIQIVTTVNSLGNPPIVNNAGLTTSALTNNILNDNDSATITLGIGPATQLSLPSTGFAPGRATTLAAQPEELRYASTDVILEIPRLGVKIPIVGVPFKSGGWDVSWLGNQAGWLEGSAFPSWSGNSVLTGHVYSANGSPGPFLNLSTLRYGDQVIVHANGQKHVFEIRSNSVALPGDSSAFRHEELSWLTLITCKEYDPATNSYKKRVLVRAVLVSVE